MRLSARCVAVGRNNWTFAGSDEGGRRAAAIYTLIETAKLNDIDPRAWLADVLARLPDHPARRIGELLPWNWKTQIVTAVFMDETTSGDCPQFDPLVRATTESFAVEEISADPSRRFLRQDAVGSIAHFVNRQT